MGNLTSPLPIMNFLSLKVMPHTLLNAHYKKFRVFATTFLLDPNIQISFLF